MDLETKVRCEGFDFVESAELAGPNHRFSSRRNIGVLAAAMSSSI